MDVEQFWRIIEDSRAAAARGDDQLAWIERTVQALPPREMVAFEGHCWDILSLAYRRELWAVGAIIEPGCSQASFDALRAWMILEGREFYDQVCAHPEKLAERVPRGATPWAQPGNALLQLVSRVYRKSTGEEMPTVPRRVPHVLKGARWAEHELPDLQPELWRKYRA